jgi:hypothetical protein
VSTLTIERGNNVLAFDKVIPRTAPFPHFVSARFYTEQFSNTLLTWLESYPDWELKETLLFEQYQLGFSKFKHCPEVQALSDGAVLARIMERVNRAFGVAVSSRINISAHMLVVGQHGGIHTDNVPGETHRLVVQLNRGRSDDSGGNLVLLSGPSPRDVEVVFKQASNSAIGFVLGAASYHAIARVRTGTRFTIIYTFLSDLAKDAEYQYFAAK